VTAASVVFGGGHGPTPPRQVSLPHGGVTHDRHRNSDCRCRSSLSTRDTFSGNGNSTRDDCGESDRLGVATMSAYRFPVPASFFGMVLGLAGLGNCWRAAARLWSLPGAVGETIMLITVVSWALLLLAYLGKWIWARPQALAEFRHPVQCCFIGLVPVSTMLIALAIAPYAHEAAQTLFAIGAVGQLTFAIHRTGTLWMGDRDPADTTAAAYLPTVAGSFVTAIVAATLDNASLGKLFFGAGMFSWLALESVVLRRLIEVAAVPSPLRPTMGIHFAPPVVACAAYLSITSGTPDLLAQALFGYGVFQGLVLVRLIPWLRVQAFAPSYWAYTFGTAACALTSLEFLERGLQGPIEWMAPPLFVVANVVIGIVFVRTLWLLIRGKPLPVTSPAATPPEMTGAAPQLRGEIGATPVPYSSLAKN
jgi:tellurite resistance protein